MSKGIICLCGSTKFKQQFDEMNWWLTSHDYMVLSVGAFHHSTEDQALRDEILAHKEQLDRLHKEKIATADAIVVLNIGGYVGASTKSEIEYATKVGKPIFWWENQSYLGLALGQPYTGTSYRKPILPEFYQDCSKVTEAYERLWGRWHPDSQFLHVISEVCELKDVRRKNMANTAHRSIYFI